MAPGSGSARVVHLAAGIDVSIKAGVFGVPTIECCQWNVPIDGIVDAGNSGDG